jgi:hypothetical protein
MNLLEITQEAINQFDMYRYPDLDDWKEQIDKVLSELGECTIGNDKIEQLYLSNDSLEIRTSYSVRCCAQENDMSIPLSVLEADNPIKKARETFLTKELAEAEYQVKLKKNDYERAINKLNEIKQQFEGETK